MHTLKALILICQLALLNTVQAGDTLDENDILKACSAYSQAGMKDCLAKKVRESEANLKQAADKAIRLLSKWDEDAKYIATAQEKFRLSDKAFGQYREAQCAFAGALGGGAIGNALEMRRFVCVYELNISRTAQLRNAVVNLPLK